MTREGEREWVRAAVAGLRAAFKAPEDPARRGPVALERLLTEHDLRLVELPALSRAAVFDHLVAKGIDPGDLGEDEDLAGFLYLGGRYGQVFVNADDPVTRRRFTAAHELGHYVLHRDLMAGRGFGDGVATVVEVGDDQSDAMERQANRFAAELLMPASVCRAREAAFKLTYGACPRAAFAYHLASEWMVSSQAMRYRLGDLGVGDE